MTSAAIVMVAVFAIFALLRALEFKQMGVGLATAAYRSVSSKPVLGRKQTRRAYSCGRQ